MIDLTRLFAVNLRFVGRRTPAAGAGAGYLRNKHMLLLLDNFEQIIDATPLLAELMSSCQHLKLLVTSRAALHLPGEYEFPVSPLPTPDLTQTLESELLSLNPAVKLFKLRAQAVQPNFKLTPTNMHTIAEYVFTLMDYPGYRVGGNSDQNVVSSSAFGRLAPT